MGKVYSQKAMIAIRSDWKRAEKKVVFTNGVFDILHRGHVEYLNAAKRLGDILIVGINTDDSVKRLKGPQRPIVHQEDRAFIISQLISVDAVCLFEEDTPFNLISAIVPEVLVKGADYEIENIIGKDIVENSGGSVKTIEFLPERSTTNIVEKIVSSFVKK